MLEVSIDYLYGLTDEPTPVAQLVRGYCQLSSVHSVGAGVARASQNGWYHANEPVPAAPLPRGRFRAEWRRGSPPSPLNGHSRVVFWILPFL